MRPFHQTKNKEFTPYNGDTKKLIENIGRKVTIPQNRHQLQGTLKRQPQYQNKEAVRHHSRTASHHLFSKDFCQGR